MSRMSEGAEEKVYVVARSLKRRYGTASNAYFDSREEADEAYNISVKDGWRVEMLYGTPGHYEIVKAN